MNGEPASNSHPSAPPTIWDGLRILASWAARERNTQQLMQLLAIQPELGQLPDAIREQWNDLAKTNLLDFADQELLRITLDDLALQLLEGLTGHLGLIYQRRIVEGATLASIGSELGISRERVRQIQVKVETRVKEALKTSAFLPLHWRAADLHLSLGVAAPLDHSHTRRALDRSLRGTRSYSAEVLRPLLLRLAGPYKILDGWFVADEANLRRAIAIVAMADDNGILRADDAYELLSGWGVRSEFHGAWLNYFGKFRTEGDCLLVWSGNVVDKCVAILAMRNEPANVETLVSAVGEGHSIRSTRNRLSEDKRLVRVSPNEWALQAWGMEEYTTIVGEIVQRIEGSGGQAEIDQIVQEIVSLFPVKESSVRLYTTAPMFVVESGRIRVRTLQEPYTVRGTFETCAGAFQTSEDSVSLIVEINAELMRGSGQPIKGPVAAALGVSPGNARAFSFGNHALQVSWPTSSANGPSLGSARLIAGTQSAGIGDRMRLDFNVPNGLVSAELIPKELGDLDQMEAIRLLSGIRVRNENAVVFIAAAVNSSLGDVRRVLVARGDSELADLLPIPEVDENLDARFAELAKIIVRD